MGSVGKSSPILDLYSALNAPANSLRSSAVNSVSRVTPRASFISSMSFSKNALPTSMTTSEYIWMKRRYESQAQRGLPDLAISVSTTVSLIPRLRIVSIMPGMEARAPERTETSSGTSGSPNFLPCSASRVATWAKISARIASEMVSPSS